MVETFGHSTNQNSINVPKVVKAANKKMFILNFGDWCSKQSNGPFLSDYNVCLVGMQTALTYSMRHLMIITSLVVIWFNLSEIILEFPHLVTPWFQEKYITNCKRVVSKNGSRLK